MSKREQSVDFPLLLYEIRSFEACERSIVFGVKLEENVFAR